MNEKRRMSYDQHQKAVWNYSYIYNISYDATSKANNSKESQFS